MSFGRAANSSCALQQQDSRKVDLFDLHWYFVNSVRFGSGDVTGSWILETWQPSIGLTLINPKFGIKAAIK
jgi:hypothetical protein